MASKDPGEARAQVLGLEARLRKVSALPLWNCANTACPKLPSPDEEEFFQDELRADILVPF